MKNKRYRTLNMSSTFHKSLGLSSSCISEENFSNKEKHKFHSETESKGYNKKQMTWQANSFDELTNSFANIFSKQIVQHSI